MMEHARKVALVPTDDDVISDVDRKENPPDSFANIVEDPAENRGKKSKLSKQLLMGLLLAEVGGYNSQLQLKRKDGNFDPKTHIGKLVEFATKRGPEVTGLDDFIHLLHNARVPMELVINAEVRSRLANFESTRQSKEIAE